MEKKTSSLVAVIVLIILLGFVAAHDVFVPKPKVEKIDMGTCDYVKITVLEERGWKRLKGPDSLLGDIFAHGGMAVSQWTFDEWLEDIYNDPSRLALGTAFAVEVGKDGKVWKFFMGVGWNVPHMKKRYIECGFSPDLKELDFVVLCHEHMDHFWAMPGVLEVRPDITIIAPATFSETAKAKLKEWGHKGKLILTEPLKPYTHKEIPELPPGMALVTFPGWIILGINGEQAALFNVKDRGLVTTTGCCHMGIVTLANYAATHFKIERNNMYGLYGGLHIALAEDWSPERNDWLLYLKKLDFDFVGANHCTGRVTVSKMKEFGIECSWASNGHVIEFGRNIKWYNEKGELIKEIKFEG